MGGKVPVTVQSRKVCFEIYFPANSTTSVSKAGAEIEVKVQVDIGAIIVPGNILDMCRFHQM